jgi:glycosyltransferase involved in cell wall biosynthesis
VKLLALLQAKDEERHLAGWLENVGPAVDGIIALDDGSTDGTAAMLGAHPKVLEVLTNPPGGLWDERANQTRLVQASRDHGADWVLCVDADERLELRFVEQSHAVIEGAQADGLSVLRFVLRELWDDADHARVDGVWGRKTLCRLFRNDPAHRLFDPRKLHRFWMPMELVADLERTSTLTDFILYHLQMIEPEDRARRRAKYEALDPDGLYQKLGYRYLTDESGLELEAVTPEHRYEPR